MIFQTRKLKIVGIILIAIMFIAGIVGTMIQSRTKLYKGSLAKAPAAEQTATEPEPSPVTKSNIYIARAPAGPSTDTTDSIPEALPQSTPPQQAATCESNGRFTYAGPRSPGVRETGMCIDCSTETYIAYGGRCAPPVIAVNGAGRRKPSTRQIASESIEDSKILIARKSQKILVLQDKTRGAAHMTSDLYAMPAQTASGPGVFIYVGAYSLAVLSTIFRKRK